MPKKIARAQHKAGKSLRTKSLRALFREDVATLTPARKPRPMFTRAELETIFNVFSCAYTLNIRGVKLHQKLQRMLKVK